METDQAAYDRIARQIHSDTSPVGIDAKKTHIMIIRKLEQIEGHLAALRAGLEGK